MKLQLNGFFHMHDSILHCRFFLVQIINNFKTMVVGAIMKPPAFEGGRRFVLRAMVQAKRKIINFADPVVQKQQQILKGLPGVCLQKHYVYLMASVSCIFV